ncbi:helix-turn-helix domain-containing protein [Ferrovibrio sp. MS7]|uniref:winged helix-turn-helix transcriptional regulator n=1 Tax=Ferrovibrio plantarum TaxID=3119164 RepID=UPI00313497E4
MRYGTFCPAAKAAEVIMGRWTLLILSEMMLGSERFSDIQHGVPLMPRSLLARRLKELEQNGLIRREAITGGRGNRYLLTPAGDGLRPLIDQLVNWGQEWRMPFLDKRDRNVSYLMWSVRRMVLAQLTPQDNAVIGFEFTNLPRRDHKLRQWWLVLREGNADLCITDMGFEPGLMLHADLEAFTQVVMGLASLAEARRQGSIRINGDAGLMARLAGWLRLAEPPRPNFPVFSRPDDDSKACVA